VAISKEQIIEVAARLFQERGYHATSVQDIADQLGVTKAALYYYVKNKEHTLYEIFDRAMSAVEHRIMDIIDTNLKAEEKLTRLIAMHIRALLDEITIITVFFNERIHLPPEHQAIVNMRRRQYEEKIAQIIREGTATGIFKEVDALPTAYAILGMCNWLYQWYNPYGRLKPDELAQLYSSIILKGMLAPQKTSKLKTESRSLWPE